MNKDDKNFSERTSTGNFDAEHGQSMQGGYTPPAFNLIAGDSAQMKSQESESSLDSGEDSDAGGGRLYASVPSDTRLVSQRQEVQNPQSSEEFRTVDPDKAAKEIFDLVTLLYNNRRIQEFQINGVVANLTQESANEVVAAYRNNHGRDLIQDIYLFMDKVGGYSSGIYAPISWLLDGRNSFASGQAAPQQTPRTPGTNNTLLPGSDPRWGDNYVYVDLPERFAVLGRPVTLYHVDTEQFYENIGGTPAARPEMKRAIMDTPNDVNLEPNVVRESNTRQKITFTPQNEGPYHVQCYITHPNGQNQVLWHTIEVKSLANISQAALNTDAATQSGNQSFEEFRGQVEMQDLALSQGGIQNQNTGPQHISSSAPNPIQGKLHQSGRYSAMGFRGGTAKYRWYALARGEALPEGNLYGMERASGEILSRYPEGSNQKLYKMSSTSLFSEMTLYRAGQFTVIAEEVDNNGRFTGRSARYLQAVLNSDQKDQLDQWRQYKGQIDSSIDRLTEGGEVPVQATYTQKNNGASNVLTLFLGPDKEKTGKWTLLDLTPGAAYREFTADTPDGAINEFDKGNSYPDGMISLRVNSNNRGVPALSRNFETDGATFLQSISQTSGWVSLGLTVAGLAAGAVLGPVLIPFLLIAGGAAAGVVSGGTSLADRFRQAEPSSTGITLDILTIASSIAGAGAAFKALRGGATALQLTTGGRMLMFSNLALDGASTIVMSVEGVEQINQILESGLSRGEKIGAIARVVANLALTAGLFALSVKDVNSAKNNLSQYFGREVIDSLDNRVLYTLSLLDNGQLQALQRVPRGELTQYLDLVSSDWIKGRSLLQLGEFANFSAFRSIFNEVDTVTAQRLSRALDPDYMAGLSTRMQGRYQTLIDDIKKGQVTGQDLPTRLEVLDETRVLRDAIGTAAENTSRTQSRRISIASRNIAYGDFSLNLPDGSTISGNLASVAGDGVSTRINNLDDAGLDQALAGRTVVGDINDSERIFQFTVKERRNDSEIKIMEYIGNLIQQRTGTPLRWDGSYTGFSGTINVASEMSPCTSCANILQQQVTSMFGGSIRVNVSYGVNFTE